MSGKMTKKHFVKKFCLKFVRHQARGQIFGFDIRKNYLMRWGSSGFTSLMGSSSRKAKFLNLQFAFATIFAGLAAHQILNQLKECSSLQEEQEKKLFEHHFERTEGVAAVLLIFLSRKINLVFQCGFLLFSLLFRISQRKT